MLDTIWIVAIFLGSIAFGVWFGWVQADPHGDVGSTLIPGLLATGGMSAAFALAWAHVGGPAESWLENVLPQSGQDINTATSWVITLLVHLFIIVGLLTGASLIGDWLWGRFHLVGRAAGPSDGGAAPRSGRPEHGKRFNAIDALARSLTREPRSPGPKRRPRAPGRE